MESQGLENLIKNGIQRSQKRPTAKAYVKQHKDRIFVALEQGAKYADIRAAFESDGVVISEQYFKELMLGLKQKQAGYKPTRTTKPKAKPVPRLSKSQREASERALADLRAKEADLASRRRKKPAASITEPVRDPNTIDFVEGKTDAEAKRELSGSEMLAALRAKHLGKPVAPILTGTEAQRIAKERVAADKERLAAEAKAKEVEALEQAKAELNRQRAEIKTSGRLQRFMDKFK